MEAAPHKDEPHRALLEVLSEQPPPCRSLSKGLISFWDSYSRRTTFLPVNEHRSKLLSLTLEEIGCKACFIDGTVGHKLHPQSVGTGFDSFWLLIATEVANQGALLCGTVTNFQIVIGTAVVPFNLKRKTEATWMTLAGPASISFLMQNQNLIITLKSNKVAAPVATVRVDQTGEGIREAKEMDLQWVSSSLFLTKSGNVPLSRCESECVCMCYVCMCV